MFKNICVNYTITAEQEETIYNLYKYTKSKGLEFKSPESMFENIMITGAILDIDHKINLFKKTLEERYVPALSGSYR